MGMNLTKEFVNSCRKVGVLRDFLCQAIDQVDKKDKETAELKESYNDMDVAHTVHIAKMNAMIEELENSVDFWKKKNRRLKRALWLARAKAADEVHFMWCQFIYDKKYGIVKFNVKKDWGENVKHRQTLHTPQGWADVWDVVERKCRAKAEEYR